MSRERDFVGNFREHGFVTHSFSNCAANIPSSTRVKHACTFIPWFKLPFHSRSSDQPSDRPPNYFSSQSFRRKEDDFPSWWRRRQEIRDARYKTQTNPTVLSPDTFASFQPWALREEYRHPRGISSLETAIPPRWKSFRPRFSDSVSGFLLSILFSF